MDPARDERRVIDRVREVTDSLQLAPAHVAVLAIMASCACAGLVALWWLAQPTPARSPVEGLSAAPSTRPTTVTAQSSAAPVVVHVSGAVASEGVVELPAGSRVVDAVSAVGGPRRRAQTDDLNLARVLRDGEQIHVPRVGEVPAASGAGSRAVPGSGADSGTGSASAGPGPGALVDLNVASTVELDTLPGVGPVLAGRIVAHREAIGGFASIEQLLEVAGIGEKTFAALRDLVSV